MFRREWPLFLRRRRSTLRVNDRGRMGAAALSGAPEVRQAAGDLERNKERWTASKPQEKGSSELSGQSDEALVREFVRENSRGAFAELYYRYKDKAFNTAYRIVGDYEAARDVVHDVFLKIHMEAPGFQFRSSFSSWLYRIVVNRSLDETKRIKRRKAEVSTDTVKDSLISVNEMEQPESAALEQEAEGQLAVALERLSPKLKTVITLRYFEGLTYEQIAEIMQRPVGTVKSRLRRAHRGLARALMEKGPKGVREGGYGLFDVSGANA